MKWRGVPVWSHDGIICTGETYKSVVKMTFAKGASVDDPAGLFNSSLEGNVRRAIDIREGEKINEKALKALIRAAVALNISKSCRQEHRQDKIKTENVSASRSRGTIFAPSKKKKSPVSGALFCSGKQFLLPLMADSSRIFVRLD